MCCQTVSSVTAKLVIFAFLSFQLMPNFFRLFPFCISRLSARIMDHGNGYRKKGVEIMQIVETHHVAIAGSKLALACCKSSLID